MAEYRPPGSPSSNEVNYRPRTVSAIEQAAGGNDFPPVQDPALTPIPPQTAVSLVEQNEQPVPLPRPAAERQGINAAQLHAPQQQPQQQMPVHGVQPPPDLQMMPPPPYYSQYGVGMPQQYPYMCPAVQPQMVGPAVPAEQVKVTNQRNPVSFKVQYKASYSFCTGWKGILEITARVGVLVVAAACLGLSSVILHTIDSNSNLDALLSTGSNSFTPGRDIFVDVQDLIALTRSLAGYMIFVAVLAFVVESPTILGRFTLRAGNGMLRILHVVDAIAAVILAIFFLCGMAPAASYASQWGEPPLLCEGLELPEVNNTLGISCDDQELTAELASLSAVGFLGLVLMVFLTAWKIIAAITIWDRVDDSTESRANVDSHAPSAI